MPRARRAALLGGGVSAYVDLNFAAAKFKAGTSSAGDLTALPGFTFTRASLAMGYDATGKLTYGPNNLNTYSEQFDNAAWTKSGAGAASAPVITANQALAPDGTMTADLAVFTLNGGTASGDISGIQQTVSSVGPSIQSLWARTSDGTTKVFSYVPPSGAVVSAVTITPTWQRISLADSSAGTASHRLRLRGSASGEGTATSASIYLWGAQLEAVTYQTTPSTYYPTTTAAYYGPRLVYDPVTLASLGILVEEARTNLCLQSQTLGTTWSPSNTTVGSDVTASPDGTSNADKLQEDAATSTHGLQQFLAYSNATAYTLSGYFKAAERSWCWLFFPSAAFTATSGYYFNLATGVVGAAIGSGVTAAIQSVGNGWYRCSITKTSTAAASGNTGFGIATADVTNSYTGTTGSGIYAFGLQLEAGTGASSPIPTTTASVTRAADVPAVTGLNVTYPLSMVSTFQRDWDAGSAQIITQVDAGSNSQRAYLLVNASDLFAAAAAGGSTTGNTSVSGATTPGVAYVGAMRALTDDFVAARDGALSVVDANFGYPTTATTLRIGGESGGAYLNGTISRIRIYNRALSDAQLQSLTS